ncbi:MAG: hypothetical protein PHU63_04605 [Candidatus ainarchaeum sp.]|nr:hypothetical protein [Candidatus ainarchaeum sp.]
MEFIKDISVVVGLWILFYNLSAWQREHRGKRNIELAEETLALFYEAKDVIAWMRNPMGFTNETDSIKQEERESNEEFEARKRASFIFVRYNQNKELFNKIHSFRYRFMAQIGKEEVKPFYDLDKLIKEIVTSARMLVFLWSEKYHKNEEEQEKKREQINKHEKIIWDTFSDDDPINAKVDKLILDIEKICKDVIMARGTLHGFLNLPIKSEGK